MIEREVRVISSKTREYSVYLNDSIERYGIEEFKLQIEKKTILQAHLNLTQRST